MVFNVKVRYLCLGVFVYSMHSSLSGCKVLATGSINNTEPPHDKMACAPSEDSDQPGIRLV